MLQCVTLSVILVTCLRTGAEAEPVHLVDEEVDELWTNFKTSYSKVYNDDREDFYRRSVWQNNLHYIQKHNIEADLGMHDYTLGVNEYADLTVDEYRKLLLGTRVPSSDNLTESFEYIAHDDDWFSYSDLPSTVDWRTKGYVTAVKNQGRCGSCWAFASTGALEGQTFNKTGRLVSLSEQNLVDCSTSFGNAGCNGGMMDKAFNYIRMNGGIDTTASYPYEGRENYCRFKTLGVGAKCRGYKMLPRGSEASLQRAVAVVGPIAVAVDAGQRSFQLYKSGVYNEPACTPRVNHAVLVVGYGKFGRNDYWLVKNSWGTSWGQAGYIMMSRYKRNQCGIASFAIYPIV